MHHAEEDEDFLAAFVAKRTAKNPDFPALVEAAESRRSFMRKVAKIREQQGQSQTEIAAAMKTSASVVSRIENGGNVNTSTLDRYFCAVGVRVVQKAVSR
jgi:ribosome-binding protein aMBF1 (putative translation factor)